MSGEGRLSRRELLKKAGAGAAAASDGWGTPPAASDAPISSAAAPVSVNSSVLLTAVCVLLKRTAESLTGTAVVSGWEAFSPGPHT